MYVNHCTETNITCTREQPTMTATTAGSATTRLQQHWQCGKERWKIDLYTMRFSIGILRVRVEYVEATFQVY